MKHYQSHTMAIRWGEVAWFPVGRTARQAPPGRFACQPGNQPALRVPEVVD